MRYSSEILVFCLLCALSINQITTTNFPALTTNQILSTIPALTISQTLSTVPQPVSQTCGVFINFREKQFYQKQYTLQGGEIQLSFDFTVFQIFQADFSGIIVSIDGKQALRVPLKNSGQIVKITSTLLKGKHIFKFTPYGINNIVSVVLIRKILIREKQCVAGWGQNNMIINGQFEQHTCPSDYLWCVYDIKDYSPASVPGWIPNPEIQVIKSSYVNQKLPDTWLAELDSYFNTCIKQKLSLKAGKYVLTFDHIARSQHVLSASGLQVKINGLVVKTINPTNYELNKETIQLELKHSCEYQLEFCGIGESNANGSAIDNVKLVGYNECATTKIVEY